MGVRITFAGAYLCGFADAFGIQAIFHVPGVLHYALWVGFSLHAQCLGILAVHGTRFDVGGG